MEKRTNPAFAIAVALGIVTILSVQGFFQLVLILDMVHLRYGSFPF